MQELTVLMTFRYGAPSYKMFETKRFSYAQKRDTALLKKGKYEQIYRIERKFPFVFARNYRDIYIESEKNDKMKELLRIYDRIKWFMSDLSSSIFLWMSLFVSLRVAPPLAYIARYTSDAASCLLDSSCSKYILESQDSLCRESSLQILPYMLFYQ